jgi:hypothetical protein
MGNLILKIPWKKLESGVIPLALLENLMFDWREIVEVYILTDTKSLIEPMRLFTLQKKDYNEPR